jgi:hypothetical protein
MESNDNFQPDSIVQSVIQGFVDRAKFGKQKYGTDLDRKDLSMVQWIQHIQDELHDGILYCEKLKRELQESSIDRKIFG